MGNFFEPPYYSESQGPNTSVDYLKSMFTSIATNHEAEQEEGTMTWCAHIDDVQDVSDTSILIQSLTPIEKQKVKRFMFPDDQRRALLSILLQRTMIRQTFGVVDKDYELCRSKEVCGCIYFTIDRNGKTHSYIWYSMQRRARVFRANHWYSLATRTWTSRRGTSTCHIMANTCASSLILICW